MKNKTISLLCLAALLLGFLPKSTKALQQKKSPKNDDEKAAIEILERYVAALGGRECFARIKSVEIEIERLALGRTNKVKRIDDVAGNRTYSRQDGGNGIIELGYDGKRAWQKAPFFRGYLEASSQQAKAVSRGGIKLPGTALLDYKSSGRTFARLADEKLGVANYLVVKSDFADDAGKETQVRYYFDPATYLLKQTVSGNAVTQTETFDDYRQVEGVNVAFATTVTNPQITAGSKIISLKFNVPVDSSIFEFQETSSKATSTATDKMNTKTSVSNPTTKENDEANAASGEISEIIRLETFENVWKTINDTFYDSTFNGVNWQSVHDKYLPLVRTTKKNDEFHRLLNQMVGELHLSHFKITPPEKVFTLGSSAATNSGNGSPGLGVIWIENQLLVGEIKPNSPAEVIGIRPGYIIRRINGKTPDDIYAAYKKENPGFQFREELARARATNAELSGNLDNKVALELLDGRDNPVRVELARQANSISGGRQLEFESKRLGKNIGYIKFNLFFGDLLSKFQTALETLHDTKSLIIDLRGNPGGAGDLAPAMANLLSADAGSLGSLKFRYDTTRYTYTGTGKQAYQGKIIILTDEGTGSTSEVFAGGLQTSKRAVVIGSPSAGAVLPSTVKLLPTGGALQYVISNFQTSDGIALEGRGVVPDINIKPSRADLLAGRDSALERAIKFSE